MVLYGITLVPLEEEIHVADPALLATFYADNAAFYGSAYQSAWLLTLLLKWDQVWVCYPDTSNSLFISDLTDQEATTRRDF